MARDMTRGQFKAALQRNGFRQVMLWIDRPAAPGLSVGIICKRDGTIMRRETIAHAIKSFREHDAKAVAS